MDPARSARPTRQRGDVAVSPQARPKDGEETGVDDLLGQSRQLRSLRSLEAGTADQVSPYTLLMRGDLEGTANLRGADPRALRLLGASEGAPGAVVQRALALPLDEGIDDATMWASLALAVREHADTTALLALAEERTGVAELMLRFTDRAHVRDAPESLPSGLTAQMRGFGRIMALVALGTDAPAVWRADVRRLLLPPERPYFALAPEGNDESDLNGG